MSRRSKSGTNSLNVTVDDPILMKVCNPRNDILGLRVYCMNACSMEEWTILQISSNVRLLPYVDNLEVFQGLPKR